MKKSCNTIFPLDKKVAIYSFDVFDTAFVRRWAKPHDLFYFLEKELVAEDECWGGFAEQRIAAELDLRRKVDFASEVTIANIYGLLSTRCNLTAGQANRVMDRELLEEKKSIQANPEMKRQIDILRGMGKRIVFITDIYLPKEFISSLLTEHGLLLEHDGLYVSSEIGVLKATGAMYDHVLKAEQCTREEIFHVGDNREWDYNVPQKKGIKAFCYERTRLTRYEENIILSNILDPLTRSLLAGAMRSVRLACPYDDDHFRTIWDVTANVSGPLMVGYVKWILDQAVKMNLKRLYFLSRDGQVLLKIAEIIKQALGYVLELNYLCVSRQSLLAPALTEINDEELEWIMAPTSFLSIRLVFRRMNFEPEEFNHLLAEYGLSPERFDVQITVEELKSLRNLLKDIRTSQRILSRSESARLNLVGYLRQEGVTCDPRFAIVDIGWNGTLQRSISRILDKAGFGFPVRGFYFGLRRKLRFKETDELYAYFSSPDTPSSIESKVYIIPMIELFTSADHGVVLTHESNKGAFRPVLKLADKNLVVEWGVSIQHEAMEAVTRYMMRHFTKDFNTNDIYVELFQENLSFFMIKPFITEASAYGYFPIYEEQGDSYYKKLASKYSIIELLLHKFRGYRHHHNEWACGSLAMSSNIIKRIIGLR